jgi:hypothetical protein
MTAAGSGRNGGDGDVQDDDVAASNAASRQYDWRPRPDPTLLTTQGLRDLETGLNRTILERISGLREVLEQRLQGMDKATELLAATVDRIPGQAMTDLEHARVEAIQRFESLRELIEQRLSGMDKATELLAATVDRVPSETDKATHALRELLSSRIDGMDQATRLLASNFEKVPSDIDRSTHALREVMQGEINQVSAVMLEKFAAVDDLFTSNATALTAALAAQEKAVAAQNDSNTLAIDKSERTTIETIKANAAQTTSGLTGLSGIMDDLKSRVVRLEGLIQQTRIASEDSLAVNTFGQTAEQNRSVQARATMQLAIAAISAIVAVVAVLFATLHK